MTTAKKFLKKKKDKNNNTFKIIKKINYKMKNVEDNNLEKKYFEFSTSWHATPKMNYKLKI